MNKWTKSEDTKFYRPDLRQTRLSEEELKELKDFFGKELPIEEDK